MTDWVPIAGPLGARRRPGSGPRLVLLHGFTQTGRSWQPVVDLLPDDIDVWCPDAPGHGDSRPTTANLETAALLVVETIGCARWVGYSMGGRTALRAALDHPEAVESLVLIGATAGIDDPAERARRVRDDEALARSLETDGIDHFLGEWLAGPLFASLSTEAANMEDRRRNEAAGLAASLRSMGTGRQEPLWSRLHEGRCSLRFVAGGRDEKFTSVGERLTATWGGPSQMTVVPDVGHAVHLESPGIVASMLASMLRDD